MNWNWTEAEKHFLFVIELKAIETFSLFSQNIKDIKITHTHTKKMRGVDEALFMSSLDFNPYLFNLLIKKYLP